MLDKLLRYLALTIIIFLVLRFLPFFSIDNSTAILIALFILVAIFLTEFLINLLRNDQPYEKFDNCPTCPLSISASSNDCNPATQKCRIVCDNQPKQPDLYQKHGYAGMFYDEYPFYNRQRTNEKLHLENTGDKYRSYHINPEQTSSSAKYEIDRQEAAYSTSGYSTPVQEVGSKSQKLKDVENKRLLLGPIDDELPYTDYNHLPVA